MNEPNTERWRGKAKGVIEIDEQGREMRFDTIEIAAEAAGVSRSVMTRLILQGKSHDGLTYRLEQKGGCP